MKKIILLSAAAASTLILTSCGENENICKNPEVTAQGNQTMADNKAQTGLKSEVLQPGAGASPEAGQKVTVHYTGWLDNNGQPGTKFDSSLDRNQPFTFTIGVGQVIKGWDQGVMEMKVGEKRRLTIPAELGYGANGAGRIIPPNATLIFDVELLKVS